MGQFINTERLIAHFPSNTCPCRPIRGLHIQGAKCVIRGSWTLSYIAQKMKEKDIDEETIFDITGHANLTPRPYHSIP